MATQTTNYNLTKIALTDAPPDITVLNANWDTIDDKLKAALNGNRESALSIANGGTGAITTQGANVAINYRGHSSAPAADLPSSYPSGANFYIESPQSVLPYKPSTYGILVTWSNGTEVSQLWFNQVGSQIFRRRGNATGWNGQATVPTNRGWVPLQIGSVSTASVG